MMRKDLICELSLVHGSIKQTSDNCYYSLIRYILMLAIFIFASNLRNCYWYKDAFTNTWQAATRQIFTPGFPIPGSRKFMLHLLA